MRSETEIANHYSSGLPFSVDTHTLGLWHMDENSGSTFANSVSGNGDLFNGASFVSGRFGNAVAFDGIDDRGDCNINIPEYDITIEFWAKLDGMQTNTCMVEAYGMYNTRINAFVDTINPTIWSTGNTTSSITVSPNQTTTYWSSQTK